MAPRDHGGARPRGHGPAVMPPADRRHRRTIRIRDVGPDEGHLVDVVFAGMSDRSRRLRFHGPMPRLPDTMRRVLTSVDGRRHVAVVAEVRHHAAWHPVGLGRIITDEDGTVELAVSVVDAWHGHGIGTRMVRGLRDRARTLGIRELVAEVVADNAPMLHVLRRELSIRDTQRSGPALRIVCHVPGPWDLELTHEDLLEALAA